MIQARRPVGSGASAAIALAALAGWVITTVASGTSSPAGDQSDSFERMLRNIHDSRRLFVLSHFLIVVASVATLVAVVAFVAAHSDRASKPTGAPVAVSALAVWCASVVIAAAARAHLVRYDFSIVDREFRDYTPVLVIVNVADYVAAFGLVAFVVAAGWTAYALADPYGELQLAVYGAGFAAALASPAAIGSAFPTVRDGRFGDTSALRPGGGSAIVFLVGWVIVVAAILLAEIRMRRIRTTDGS